MEGIEYLQLAEEDLPTELVQQLSQESLTVVSQARSHVEPNIGETSNLGSVGCVNVVVSLPKMETGLNAAAPRLSIYSH